MGQDLKVNAGEIIDKEEPEMTIAMPRQALTNKEDGREDVDSEKEESELTKVPPKPPPINMDMDEPIEYKKALEKEKAEKTALQKGDNPVNVVFKDKEEKVPDGITLTPSGDWSKAIFIKSGIADVERDDKGRISAMKIPVDDKEHPLQGLKDAKIIIRMNNPRETVRKFGYEAKDLRGSKFKDWGVVKPKRASATFEIEGMVDGKKVTLEIGLKEVRTIIDNRNRDMDKEVFCALANKINKKIAKDKDKEVPVHDTAKNKQANEILRA